jgi:hypothetical protein
MKRRIRIVAGLAAALTAALLAGTYPLMPVVAADGEEAAEDDSEDVGDWILRLFRGIGKDEEAPEARGEGGAGTGANPGGGSTGGGDDNGDDDGGGDEGGGDDNGGDDGGDDGGGDDGGDDD